MDILRPTLKLLKTFQRSPETNLKLLLSRYLEQETTAPGKHPLSHSGLTRTVYGVIRKQRLLDYIIDGFARKGGGKIKIEEEVRILLRLGVYLLLFSGGYPGYAVVNEAAGAARPRARGFVNALLRRCVKEKEQLLQKIETLKDLPVKYSISPLWVRELEHLAPEPEPLLAYLDREPGFHIRVNRRRFQYDAVKKVLEAEQLTFKELPRSDAFTVSGGHGAGTRLRRLLEVEKYFYFQNTASQFISHVAASFAGDRVLDGCAAPGTKSVTLSMLRPGIEIYANDIYHKRIRLLDRFCQDYGLTGIRTMVSDIRRPALKPAVDLVLLDAPCSSGGTLRKNPDLKLKITEAGIKENAQRQKEILAAMLEFMAPAGGYVLYSVCSFTRAETEDVLAGAEGVETVDLSPLLDEQGFLYKKARYGYYLLPSDHLDNDLFYIALLKISGD